MLTEQEEEGLEKKLRILVSSNEDDGNIVTELRLSQKSRLS